MGWEMSKDGQAPLVYSPVTFIADHTKIETRLILVEGDNGAFKYDFIAEEEFQRKIEEASRRNSFQGGLPLVPIANHEEAGRCLSAAKQGDMSEAARLVRWFEEHDEPDQAAYWRTRWYEARNSGIVKWPLLPPPFSRYYIFNERDVLQSEKAASLGDLDAMEGLASWYREHGLQEKSRYWAERRMEEMSRRGTGQVQRATK